MPVRLHDAVGSALWLAAAIVAWLAAVWLAQPALADAAAGGVAYDRGDYARALAEWRGAAEAGDAAAQFGLGRLYEYGLAGLQQDYKEADHWYELAAAQDDGDAAYRLALIWSVGNADFPPDLVEAYQWATLADDDKGNTAALAAELRTQLDKIATPAQQADGRQRASAWREAHSSQKQAAATPPAFAGEGEPSSALSGPTPSPPANALAPTGPAAPAPTQAPLVATNVPPPDSPQPPDGKTPLDALNDALGHIDCAAVTAQSNTPNEGLRLNGTVPSADAKAQLAALASRYFPNKRPEVDVVVIPPPLCRSLASLATLRRQGLATDGELHARLVGSNGLREGDPIKVEVHAPGWGVSLRIDYFSLDGQVQHLWPNDQEPGTRLSAGASHVFGDGTSGKVWRAGGAPFGTEAIAVIATPLPLNLGSARPVVEKGVDYLHDVAAALATSHAADKPNLLSTILVTTHGR